MLPPAPFCTAFEFSFNLSSFGCVFFFFFGCDAVAVISAFIFFAGFVPLIPVPFAGNEPPFVIPPFGPAPAAEVGPAAGIGGALLLSFFSFHFPAFSAAFLAEGGI